MHAYSYGTPIRIWDIILAHTRTGYPIRVWDVPYAYGTSHTRMGQYTHMGQNTHTFHQQKYIRLMYNTCVVKAEWIQLTELPVAYLHHHLMYQWERSRLTVVSRVAKKNSLRNVYQESIIRAGIACKKTYGKTNLYTTRILSLSLIQTSNHSISS